MANWSNPTLTSTYTDFLGELKNRDDDLAKQFDGTTSSNLATGTIRWNSTANRWQKWSGSAWAELTGTYALTALTTTGNASIGGTLAVTGATTLAAATATTPATGNNSTAVATTAYVQAQAYAPLASPALTGTPTVPTAAVNTNTTQAASTAFVQAEIANDAPSKTGVGASGTWGISVTGNAATATRLTADRTINGVVFNGTGSINVPDLRADNGTILVDGTGVTSAVNYVSLTNAAAAGTVTLSTAGADANIPLQLTTKGTGAVTISTAGGNIALRPTAGSVLFYDATNTYYTNLDNGSLTANRSLIMPNANVTLVSGTMVASGGALGTPSSGTLTNCTGFPTLNQSTTGNAATATNLSSNRTFQITGDVAGSVSSNLSSGASIPVTISAGIIDNANISATAGIVDTKLATIATAGKISDSALPATISSSITGNAATATNCSRSVLAGTNMTGGGALSGNVTLSLSATPSVTTVQHSGNVFSGSNDTTISSTGERSVIGAGVLHLCNTDGAGGDNVCTVQRSASNGNAVRFVRGTSSVGTISVTGSATSYNEASDYRLKENITPLSDSITRLLQLKPSRFNFIADPDTVVDGFIAHEAAAVVPESVTGEKDEVDENGDPVHQGIDKSKLVPLLTAALQEAIAKIELLEQRLTAAGIA